MATRESPKIERVVLLGYMCSGKSTVGESLARRLGWGFIDFDLEIERRESRAVWEIIDANGENYFRSLESALTHEVSDERYLVMAPGGGWITQPELLRSLVPGTHSVWLSVSPEETVRRLMSDSRDRPLKDHPDPVSAVADMLDQREPLFRLADTRIPGDGRTAEDVAFEIEQTLRTRGL